MPRDIPVGNGQMLVTFDQQYRVRDLYFPHVGQENHVGGPCRFGVWAELPPGPRPHDRRKSRVYWTDDGWTTDLRYEPETLATDVKLSHETLAVDLRCQDVVDFHRPVMIRRIDVHNRADAARDIRLVHHHDFHMYGTKVGDTAYYDPQLRSLVHYRANRYLIACFYVDGDQQIDEYATGTAGFGGAEGTWRDAEDGTLGGNPIAQGAVDSTMLCRVHVPANGTRTVYLMLGAGFSYNDLDELHRFMHREGAQGVIDRTRQFWRLWLQGASADLKDLEHHGLDASVASLYRRSLLLVRTQCDNKGAIIAANDSDIMQFSRDTYSYLWPRDGAFVADAMDAAGFPDLARRFFEFCADRLHPRGMFLHKYNPDGSPASSWHPWVDVKGRPQMPIQEDETALVLWALHRHFERRRDIEFVRPLWPRLIRPAADFLVMYRDPDTKLPLVSYDLWEERYGVHSFTVATVYAGLKAAEQLAACFGDQRRAQQYAAVAEETREAFGKYLWSKEHNRFLRRVFPLDIDRNAALMAEVFAGRAPQSTPPTGKVDGVAGTINGRGKRGKASAHADQIAFEPDDNLDASMYAIFALGLLPGDDPRVVSTMEQVERRLTVRTPVGGVARYINDYYHQVTDDLEKVPGNPWFICTLWMAEWHIARAESREELAQACRYLNWVADRALPSGVLAEQVHPISNAPLSVSPLTWSHATVVSTVNAYLEKARALSGEAPVVEPPARVGGPVLTTAR